MIVYNQQPMFVLKRALYREGQYLLDALTKDHGRVRAITRIPKQKTHRDTTLFEPFHKIHFSGIRKHSLTNINKAEIQQSIKVTHKNLLSGYYLNELILSLLPEGEHEPSLFSVYEQTLTKLDATSLRQFEFFLIQHLGLWPEIQSKYSAYLINQHQEMPYFIAAKKGFDANLVEALSKGEWIANHPQLKSLLQTIISIHSTRQQHSKKTALAIDRIIRR